MTLHRANIAPVEPSELLGDLHPLIEQLGSLQGLVTLDSVSASLRLQPVENFRQLQTFLELYRKTILLPEELPVINSAFAQTSRNQLRELIALDQSLDGNPVLKDFASASRRVGQSQLKRLRPLRDQRLVQRYLQAVEAGEAQGWHTIVYGITLAIYSLPLRQGLLSYGRQTLLGFIHAAALTPRISEEESLDLLDEILSPLPAAVEKLLKPGDATVQIH